MHINEVLFNFSLPISTNSCMPIILGGKCFVIDKETRTSQNTLAPVLVHSFLTPASLHFAVFKNCQRPF